MGYNLLINGVYWGYNQFTNHLLTSRDIQVGPHSTLRAPWELTVKTPENGWKMRQFPFGVAQPGRCNVC